MARLFVIPGLLYKNQNPLAHEKRVEESKRYNNKMQDLEHIGPTCMYKTYFNCRQSNISKPCLKLISDGRELHNRKF